LVGLVVRPQDRVNPTLLAFPLALEPL
jgi:hypothetical protein